MEQSMDSLFFFFHLQNEAKTPRKSQAAPRRAAIGEGSGDWWRAGRVCVAAVMTDLFTCRKHHELTHICDAPVSAATRLL